MGIALVACEGCHPADAGKASPAKEAPAALASAKLTDQDGRALTLADFRGKTLVFSFFFTSCPSVCPRETQALSEVQRRLSPALKERVRFLSVSVDPENDTPAALKKFALNNAADLSDWSFVRADQQVTQALTRELAAFAATDAGARAPSGHSTAVYLFDGSARLMQRYAGSPLDVPRLAQEIAQLDTWFRTSKGI